MKNKRIGPDKILNIVSGISIALWVIIAAVVILFAISNPTQPGMAAGRPGLKGAGPWATNLIYGLLVVQIFLSVSGIIFNVTRLKRKTDRIKLTPVISAILGITGILLSVI
jgi:hypothetical protein